MTQLDRHLSSCDVTADVTADVAEFTFKQLLHDSMQQSRDGQLKLLHC